MEIERPCLDNRDSEHIQQLEWEQWECTPGNRLRCSLRSLEVWMLLTSDNRDLLQYVPK